MRKWQRGHGMGGAQESNLIKLFTNPKGHAQVTNARICSYSAYQNTFRTKLSNQLVSLKPLNMLETNHVCNHTTWLFRSPGGSQLCKVDCKSLLLSWLQSPLKKFPGGRNELDPKGQVQPGSPEAEDTQVFAA